MRGLTLARTTLELECGALSRRQLQVLQLLSAGRTSAEMARSLGISVRVIESHRARLFSKLHATNGPQAVAVALSQGLLAPRDVLFTELET